jgi:hypothetical protein
MGCPPLLCLEDLETSACWAGAAIATAGKLAATQALPIRNLRRDMPTLVVVSLSIGSPPFVRFKSIIGTFLGGLKQLFSPLRNSLSHNFRILLASERVNGVDALFLLERYCTYQLRGMITI